MQATKLSACEVVGSGRMRHDLAIVVCVFIVMQLALVAAGVPFAGAFTMLAALAVSTWRLHRQSSSWVAIGLRRPVSLPRAAAAALGWAAAAFLVAGIMQTIATRLLHWPPPDVSRYGNLRGNLPHLLLLLGTAWVTAAFGEEMLFRGFLISKRRISTVLTATYFLPQPFQASRAKVLLAVRRSNASGSNSPPTHSKHSSPSSLSRRLRMVSRKAS
jgi:hypothetical protein